MDLNNVYDQMENAAERVNEARKLFNKAQYEARDIEEALVREMVNSGYTEFLKINMKRLGIVMRSISRVR